MYLFNFGFFNKSLKHFNFDEKAFEDYIRQTITARRYQNYSQYETRIASTLKAKQLPHTLSKEVKEKRVKLHEYSLERMTKTYISLHKNTDLLNVHIEKLKAQKKYKKDDLDRHAGEFLVAIGMQYGTEKMIEETDFLLSDASPDKKLAHMKKYLDEAVKLNDMFNKTDDKTFIDNLANNYGYFFMLAEAEDLRACAVEFGIDKAKDYNTLNQNVKKTTNTIGVLYSNICAKNTFMCNSLYTFMTDEDYCSIFRSDEFELEQLTYKSYKGEDHEYRTLHNMVKGVNTKLNHQTVLEKSLPDIRAKYPGCKFVIPTRYNIFPDSMKYAKSDKEIVTELSYSNGEIYIVDKDGKFIQELKLDAFKFLNGPDTGVSMLEDPTPTGFTNSANKLYNIINKCDPGWMKSSKEYKALKTQMKVVTELSETDISAKSEKFIDALNKLKACAQAYITSKDDPKVSKSIRTYDRLNAARKVLNAVDSTFKDMASELNNEYDKEMNKDVITNNNIKVDGGVENNLEKDTIEKVLDNENIELSIDELKEVNSYKLDNNEEVNNIPSIDELVE